MPWKVRHAYIYSNNLTWSSVTFLAEPALSYLLLSSFVSVCATGSHGASKHVTIIAFPTASQAVQYLRHELGCDTLFGLIGGLPNGYDDTNGYPVGEVIHSNRDDDNHENDLNHGVTNYPDPDHQCHLVQAYTADYLERIICSQGGLVVKQQLVPQSFSVTSLCASASLHDMNGNVRLAINSKNQLGFALDLAQHCLAFLHVPHVKIFKIKTTTNTTDGCKTSHLLNAPYCLFVTFHHITQWLGYQEHEFHGNKFKLKQQQRSGK